MLEHVALFRFSRDARGDGFYYIFWYLVFYLQFGGTFAVGVVGSWYFLI